MDQRFVKFGDIKIEKYKFQQHKNHIFIDNIDISYNWKIKTNFHNSKIPDEGSQCVCLSVILIDSVYRKNKNNDLCVFLEECKYVVKEKKTSKFITDDIEIFSDDSDIENSDEENSNEEN